jgi:hypothetical protein
MHIGMSLALLLDMELTLALALLTAANPLLIAACNASLTLDRVRRWGRGSRVCGLGSAEKGFGIGRVWGVTKSCWCWIWVRVSLSRVKEGGTSNIVGRVMEGEEMEEEEDRRRWEEMSGLRSGGITVEMLMGCVEDVLTCEFEGG